MININIDSWLLDSPKVLHFQGPTIVHAVSLQPPAFLFCQVEFVPCEKPGFCEHLQYPTYPSMNKWMKKWGGAEGTCVESWKLKVKLFAATKLNSITQLFSWKYELIHLCKAADHVSDVHTSKSKTNEWLTTWTSILNVHASNYINVHLIL